MQSIKRWLLVLLAVGLCTITSAAQDSELPHFRTDHAMRVLATDVDGRAIDDVEGCLAHLIDSQGQEQVFPCATWKRIRVGYYSLWAETDDQISPARISLSYGGSRDPGVGREFKVPVAPAGEIEIVLPSNVTQNHTVRALSLEVHGFPFERRLPVKGSRITAKVPTGRVVVGLFDQNDVAVSLSRPVNVRASSRATVRLDQPSGAILLVAFDRPPQLPEEGRSLTTITLSVGGKNYSPEIFVDAPGRMFGFWYDAPTGDGRISVDEGSLILEPSRFVTLKTGEIVTVRDCLQLRTGKEGRTR